MSVDKVPYVPSQDKRWQVSSDPESRGRVRALIDSKARVETDLAGLVPIGVSLFGSLSKGKVLNEQTKGSADIDMWIFYDIEALQNHALEVIDNNPDGEFAKRYNARLAELEKANKGLVELSPVFDAKLDWIIFTRQGKAIKLAIEDLILADFGQELKRQNGINLEANYKKGFKIRPITMNDHFSIAEAVCNHEDEVDERDFASLLSSFFHLDVGGGMRPYIKSFIEELRHLPQQRRNKLWSMVDLSVRVTKRKGEIPSEIDSKFPKTFDEAERYYK